MFFLKLANLYTALTTLYSKFPGVKADAVALYGVIETAVVAKAWNFASVAAAFSAAEKLVSDFAANWTGGVDSLLEFEGALKALFS